MYQEHWRDADESLQVHNKGLQFATYAGVLTILLGGLASFTIPRWLLDAHPVYEDLSRSSSDWKEIRQGPARTIHIWLPSERLNNYDFEFEGQIDNRSLDVAFRVANATNYYVTKLLLPNPPARVNSALLRYAVIGGQEIDRAETPIPITLRRAVDYKVLLAIHGTRFLTYVNGQLVSSWEDNRLSHGGVGFFRGDGEKARLKWVSLSNPDNFMARLKLTND